MKNNSSVVVAAAISFISVGAAQEAKASTTTQVVTDAYITVRAFIPQSRIPAPGVPYVCDYVGASHQYAGDGRGFSTAPDKDVSYRTSQTAHAHFVVAGKNKDGSPHLSVQWSASIDSIGSSHAYENGRLVATRVASGDNMSSTTSHSGDSLSAHFITEVTNPFCPARELLGHTFLTNAIQYKFDATLNSVGIVSLKGWHTNMPNFEVNVTYVDDVYVNGKLSKTGVPISMALYQSTYASPYCLAVPLNTGDLASDVLRKFFIPQCVPEKIDMENQPVIT